MPMQLERENIAGAVVLVVKDGKVLFSRGYGYGDVEKKTPVSPRQHSLPPGIHFKAVYLDRGDATGGTE